MGDVNIDVKSVKTVKQSVVVALDTNFGMVAGVPMSMNVWLTEDADHVVIYASTDRPASCVFVPRAMS